MNIIEALETPELFGSLIKDQGTFANWKVFLRALFGLPMKEDQIKTFEKFTGREKPPTSQAKEAYLIAGRRSGKSFMGAIIGCYLALFKDWRRFLSPGEQAFIMTIAADRRQAGVVFGYIKGILSLRPWTAGKRRIIQKEMTEEIQLSNGVTISVKTCDLRTLRGFTVVAAILDEASFWRSEGYANPDVEIIRALRPALATIPGSMLIALSSPYMRAGIMYEIYRDRFGKDDPDVLVWKAPTRAMNPTVDQAIIDKALRDDFAAGQAEWLGEFRADLETFLDLDLIESCVVPGRRELAPISGVSYFGFCDPSGGRGDAMTLSIVHVDKNKIIQDALRIKNPPFDPAQAAAEFSQTLKNYGLSEVTGDKYAGGWVENAFRENGITYRAAEKNKSEIYLEFLPLLAQGRVELLDDKKLVAELRGLERRTRSGGRDSVDHGPGGHDDIANATAGCCVLVQESPNKILVWRAYSKWPPWPGG